MGESSQQDEKDHQRNDAKKETATATIVGGRPPGSGRGRTDIPHGIEVLVKKASIDRAFRKVLLDKRAAAAQEIDLALSPAEVATLNAIPRSQIEQIIEKTTVPDEHRRVFLGKMAVAMLAVLGIGLSGEDSAVGQLIVRGTRPHDDKPPPFPKGIRPDMPRPREKPLPARVDEASSRLSVDVVDTATNKATVTVKYECPFEHGEIRISFRKSFVLAGRSLSYQPRMARVSRGTGEVTFTATENYGTTEWLVIEFFDSAPRCRGHRFGLRAFPQPKFIPGESMIDKCVIVRYLRHHKVWSRE